MTTDDKESGDNSGCKPGMPLDGPESDSKALVHVPRHSYGRGPEQLSPSLLAPSRAIPGRIASPDLEQPYTLHGEVWSMDLVKSLDTGWFNEKGPLSVGDVILNVHTEMSNVRTGQYKILQESMEKYGQRVPIHVSQDKRRLRDGIHRITIADTLGWCTMLVSSDRIKWHEWDESAEGQLYHTLWRQRLGMPG